MNPSKVNERWRVALAGLVAALAIPFLIIDSPAPAEGVVANDQEARQEFAAPAGEPNGAPVEDAETLANVVEVVVTIAEISPDIGRLADQAGAWGAARAEAIQDGRVATSFIAPPSVTNYALLPVVEIDSTAQTPDPGSDEPIADDEDVVLEDPPTDEPIDTTPTPNPEPGDGDGTTPDPTGEPGLEPDPGPLPEPTPSPKDGNENEDEGTATVIGEPPPPQVDGRVPPPPGGPTAAQWNALRKCESTHNYAAISPSGAYRGAYQFSQQTWDWIAGKYRPHLVGVDPIDAAPAWQDIMAYTLYAISGWDQWPICGKNLL